MRVAILGCGTIGAPLARRLSQQPGSTVGGVPLTLAQSTGAS